MRWGLTGTPGTGKTSVASMLDGAVVQLGELLEQPAYRAGYDESRDTYVADLDAIDGWLTEQPADLLVESHLAHRLAVDRVIVLRCEPDVLRGRLEGRDATPPARKIDENVEAERLDVILSQAIDRHGIEHVQEIDTTDRAPEEVAERVASIRQGDLESPPGTVSYLHDQ